MFGKRSDGTKLKNIDPIIRMTSYIMPQRYDAMVGLVQDIRCEKMDKFIEEQSKLGLTFNYMHIVIAGLVRMFAIRPKLKRFVMSGRVYTREKIDISFAVKKKMTDDSKEVTVKMSFTGKESIYEIKDMIDEEIAKNKIIVEENSTDKLVNKLLSLPHFILKPAVGFLKFMDRAGMLPKKIIEASPFHVSCFLTNMKSLGTNHVLHHLYEFGTTGVFVSMGKEKHEACVNLDKNIEVGKIMKLGLVIDERICDGLYNAKSIKVGRRHIENPELLENKLEDIEIDPDLIKPKKEKKNNPKA